MIPTFGMDGTKWRIFRAAVEQFAQRGYHAVSMRDIAKAVDIKTSSIYNHFQSKEELLTTAYDYYWEYFYRGHPSLDELLERIGQDQPVDILMCLVNYSMEAELNAFLHLIFTVAAMEMYADERAKKLIVEKMYEMPRRFFVPLFERMIEERIIEPLDIDAYLMLHSSLCHATTLMTTAQPWIDMDSWLRCHRFLMENSVRCVRSRVQTV